jgi:hypothetical protein
MQKDQYIRLTRLRKSQRCGKLGDSEILLHFALGEPTFIDEKQFQEGRLLQDIEVGGRIHLLVKDGAGCDSGTAFRSEEILEIETDVVLTQSGFYRVTMGLLGL